MSLTARIRTIDDLEIENQVVFVRTDLDCPLKKSGEVVDDTKLENALALIKVLQERGARVVVGSRQSATSRAGQKKDAPPPSIEPVAARLAEISGCDVLLPDSCAGDAVKRVLMDMRPNQLCVLENLAREEDEGKQAEAFARKLEKYADIFVADSVRALGEDSATTTILPRLLEDRAASPSMMRELSAVDRINSGIDEPRVIVWGGNTLSARLDLLMALSGKSATVLLCGVAANTVLSARGASLGRSAIEEEYLAGARTFLEQMGDRLVLPDDFLTATSLKADSGEVRSAKRLPAEELALDIGPKTQERYRHIIETSRTAIWCGTVGFHKSSVFASGTRTICEAFAKTSAFTLIAGDDSVAAARHTGADVLARIDCVARGGPATLALLNENKLVGLEALRGTT